MGGQWNSSTPVSLLLHHALSVSSSVCSWPLMCSQHRQPCLSQQLSDVLVTMHCLPFRSSVCAEAMVWCRLSPMVVNPEPDLAHLLQMIPITQKYCIVMQEFCKERSKIQWCLNCSSCATGILYTREKL